jgi:hypothetical protein
MFPSSAKIIFDQFDDFSSEPFIWNFVAGASKELPFFEMFFCLNFSSLSSGFFQNRCCTRVCEPSGVFRENRYGRMDVHTPFFQYGAKPCLISVAGVAEVSAGG